MTTSESDAHILHVFFGPAETEEQAEARIREDLHRRGVGPGGPASSPPPLPPHPPAIPPQPDAADADQELEEEADYEGFSDWLRAKRAARTAAQDAEADPADDQEAEEEPEAAPAKALNDRLVDWWSSHKPHLGDRDDDPQPDDDDPEPDDDEEQPAARGPRPNRRRVSKDDGDDEDDEPDDEDEGDGKAAKRKKGKGPKEPRWSRPALGRPPGLPAEKHNLFTWWRGMAPHNKWLLYHGTGLGAGLYFGVPAWGYEGHRFIVNPRAGEFEVWSTWGLLALLLMADYGVRHLFPPLAWAVRGVSTSVLVGAAWYGTPLADITL